MSNKFRRRVGAAADVRELEYVSALHQSSLELREDGRVGSLDITRFLCSRIPGLVLSHEHDGIRIQRGLCGGIIGQDVIDSILENVKQESSGSNNVMDLEQRARKQIEERMEERNNKKILLLRRWAKRGKHSQENKDSMSTNGGGGGDNHDKEDNNHVVEYVEQEDEEGCADDGDDEESTKEEYMDLVQMTAIILMPTLARAGQEWRDARHAQQQKERLDPALSTPSSSSSLLLQSQPPPPLQSTTSPSNNNILSGLKGRVRQLVDRFKAKQQQKQALIAESLKPKPETLLQDVLSSMLQSIQPTTVLNEEFTSTSANASTAIDVTDKDKSDNGVVGQQQDQYYPVLTADLVKELLLYHGEYERAADNVLVDKMVQAATVGGQSSSTSGLPLLNEEAFVQALTSDMAQWNVGCEDNETTTVYDVWGFESYAEKAVVEEEEAKEEKQNANREKEVVEGEEAKDEEQEASRDGAEPSDICAVASSYTKEESSKYVFNRPPTIIDIDFAVDSFSFTSLTVAIFLFFICTSLVYMVLLQQIPALDPKCNTDEFACILGSKVIIWMIFGVVLALSGYTVIIPLSVGNNPAERSPRRNFVAFVVAMIITWIPFLVVESYQRGIDEPSTPPEQTVNRSDYDGAQWVTRAIGMFVSALMFVQFLLSLISERRIRKSKALSALMLPANTRGTARTKKAATRKINKLLENAHKLIPVDREQQSDMKEEIMINYVLKGESFEDCGGFLWTWKRTITGALFDEEGVWIMSRLIIIQTVQVLFVGFWGYTLFLFVEEAANLAEQAQEDLVPDLYPQWVYDIVPTAEQTKAALYPALGVALFVGLVIIFIYLPSYVGRVIQYRCGLLPSLKEPEKFAPFRVAADTVYTNIGNAIFALVGSSVLFFSIVGLVLFLFIWPFSRDFMILLLAWLVGLAITIVVKIMLVKSCRRSFYAGFFRTNPMAANLTTLALECWFIGLGGGVLVGRFLQFFLAACYFVGRIDVPFLSSDVALLGYAFDYVPRNFVKDILVHEAHRHPYMERLLAMYLMKLKNDDFGSEAGACWRQLFVVALMPWLIKYRVFSDSRLEVSMMEEYNARRLEHNTLKNRAFLESKSNEERQSQIVRRNTLVSAWTSSRVLDPGETVGIERTLTDNLVPNRSQHLPFN